MARLVNRLSAVKVAAIHTPGLHPDGAGLYLKVTEGGTRSWIFRYTRNGKTRDMGIGPYPAISLAKARESAAQARKQLVDGADPLSEKSLKRRRETAIASRETTFAACAEALITSQESGWRNPKHRAQWRSTLTTYVYPTLGRLDVRDVDTAAIIQVLEPIWTTRTETASRIRGRIESVLGWATAHGLREGPNPATWRGHLNKLLPASSKVRRTRHHPALSYAELPSFLTSLRQQNGVAPTALEFLILTASRTSEVLQAEWREFDLVSRVWTVPAERMKAGKQHRVPLSDRAIKLLEKMSPLKEAGYVFPGGKQGRPLSNMALLMLLRSLHPGVTTHGFRSTFRDWAAEMTDFPREIAESSLAHTISSDAEAPYLRSDLLDRRRVLLELWSTYCSHEVAE